LVSWRAWPKRFACRGTPADAYGLLRSSIQDDNPVLFFEHKGLYQLMGEVDRSLTVPLGKADVIRVGSDATIVANQAMRKIVTAAADELARRGIEVEIIDPRSLAPFDFTTVAASIEKTNYLVRGRGELGTGQLGNDPRHPNRDRPF